MTNIRAVLLQVGYGDAESPGERLTRVEALVRSAVAEHRPDLVVLPELWLSGGFHYQDWAAQAEAIEGPFVTAMAALARECGVVLHAGSFVERLPEPGPEGKSLANTSILLGADGGLLATYRKIHRFGFAAGEPALMEAGRGWVVVPVTLGGDRPGGGANAEVVKVGLATCYDLRFPELFRLLGEAGADLVVIPAAWPLARVGHWRLLGRARAIENQAVVLQANTGGTHAGVAMGGHTQVVAATGDILGELTDTAEGVLRVEIDLAAMRDYRRAFPVLADRRL